MTRDQQSGGEISSLSLNLESTHNGGEIPAANLDSVTIHNNEYNGGEIPAANLDSAAPQSGGEIPAVNSDSALGMVPLQEVNGIEPSSGLQSILVELKVPRNQEMAAMQLVQERTIASFQMDTNYDPIPMNPSPEMAVQFAEDEEIMIVRGQIEASRIPELEAQPNVIKVYRDTPIAPFISTLPEKSSSTLVLPTAAAATCPIGTCDCASGTAKGTIADVATYLGVDRIWATGHRGEGIVVGVVDGGITAEGRPVLAGETSRRIPRVIGGWPTADWGTRASAWSEHGNMCATDVLGMAPQARIYDIRISGGSTSATISAALAGFQWAINQHRVDGTPHILSNSWGIFQEAWDSVYARDPNHPFTRKVVEAINQGILVLFAAGNCGGTCPDGRCGSDSGPGRSIWGANGHPMVMTVGAVNRNEQFVGYSSQGPAALDPQKPDFCSITHFRGYFGSDSGTSAATPIAAGVVALLKQAKPAMTQDQAKHALHSTAKDIGAAGWDQHSGAGIIQAKAAFDYSPARFNAVWVKSNQDRVAVWGWARQHFDGRAKELHAQGYKLVDLNAFMLPEGDRFNAIWVKNNEDRVAVWGWARQHFDGRAKELQAQGYRLDRLNAFVLPGQGERFNAIWVRNNEDRTAVWGWAREHFDGRAKDLHAQGYKLIDLNAFVLPEGERFNAIWVKNNEDRTALWGWAREHFDGRAKELHAQGYRLMTLNAFVLPNRQGERFNAIWRKSSEDRPAIWGWAREHFDGRAAQMQAQGYRLADLNAFVLS
ncbi:MAG: S8 family serine peptidase [Leptolyngbya sp. IPPAS B-1204]